MIANIISKSVDLDCIFTFLIVFLERNELSIHAITWKNLENNMLKKSSQT